MNAVVIGLGSMGKRRVRNLQALGVARIAGCDVRDDRRAEAAARYGIPVHDALEAALDAVGRAVLIISTPPEHHMTYAWKGFERGLSCFIEASVVDGDRILELHQRTTGTDVLMAPSCTMLYYPGPRRVKALIRDGAIGRPLNVNYQTGQYLPDWHPWEPIQDYYVSRRETGGGREIVPGPSHWPASRRESAISVPILMTSITVSCATRTTFWPT
jgi:predicted dehydrogenase